MADRLDRLTRRLDRTALAMRLEGPAASTFERVAGPKLKAEAAAAGAAAFGADMRPWSKKAVAAKIGYDSESSTGRLRIVLKLRPAGLWAFGEHGAGPHLIGLKRSGRKARIRTQTLHGATYTHPVRGPIVHPGAPGRGAIRYVFKRVRRAQREACLAGIRAVLEEVRRGR